MQCQSITIKDKQAYPRLTSLWNKSLAEITVAGNLDILADSKQLTGLFCSRKCPGSLILPALDYITFLRDAGDTIVSGFHSEMEQECLKILLRGSQPVIMCPARAIQNMRFSRQWKNAFEEDRLLIISPFDEGQKRATVKLAKQRNHFVASLADQLFVIHTQKGTDTYNIAESALGSGKKIYSIKGEENQALIQAGATVLL